MKAIYEEAYQIIVRLGPATDNSDLAMAKICSIYAQYNSVKGQLMGKNISLKEAGELALETLVREDVAPVVLTQRLPAPNDGNPWPALRKFFQRPWWNRVWIIQESTTKIETSFLCGDLVISWNQIFTAQSVLYRLTDQPSFISLQKEDIGSAAKLALFRLNRDKLAHRYMGLIEVIRLFSSYNATNEKDKVFAALPLTSDYNASWDLQIDYNKTLRQIFMDVTKQTIACSSAFGHRLDFLAIKPEEDLWHDFLSLDPDLPSWVPDLRRCRTGREPLQKHLSRSIGGQFNKAENLVYSASGRSFPSVFRGLVTFPLTSISGHRLFLTGFGISTISMSVGAVPTSLPGQLGVDAIDEYKWRPQNLNDLYFTGETMEKAYLRTIVADVGDGPREEIYRGNSMKFIRTRGETKETLGPVPGGDNNFGLLKQATERRLFIYTVNGLMGLVPAETRPGDQIFVVLESQVLHVLRPVSSYYRYIGECYLHGHMDGKILAAVPYLRQFRRLEIS